ncbi:hypothetical protein [Stratiformator vulcanicus]|uniref:hypothetical protein n=1 Tax=Stratiformator vulcanicus TaxID=2527980 RepID=UPI0011AAD200|nr:hypothetical protein [Stratiformator vulcanicus]
MEIVLLAKFANLFSAVGIVLSGLALPHAHGSAAVGEPDDHAHRPHFHFGQHGHCDCHEHGEHDDENTPAPPHDDDAVYVDGDLIAATSGVKVPSVLETSPLWMAMEVADSSPSRIGWRVALRRPPDRDALPVYLRTESLRL